jgi:hypothetical protein
MDGLDFFSVAGEGRRVGGLFYSRSARDKERGTAACGLHSDPSTYSRDTWGPSGMDNGPAAREVTTPTPVDLFCVVNHTATTGGYPFV